MYHHIRSGNVEGLNGNSGFAIPLLSKTLIIVLLYAKQVRVPTSMGILTVKIRCCWCLVKKRENVSFFWLRLLVIFSGISTELAVWKGNVLVDEYLLHSEVLSGKRTIDLTVKFNNFLE